jgi:hypothetical protein
VESKLVNLPCRTPLLVFIEMKWNTKRFLSCASFILSEFLLFCMNISSILAYSITARPGSSLLWASRVLEVADKMNIDRSIFVPTVNIRIWYIYITGVIWGVRNSDSCSRGFGVEYGLERGCSSTFYCYGPCYSAHAVVGNLEPLTSKFSPVYQ